MNNSDMPAMPTLPDHIGDFGLFYETGMCGLTKREHFAGLAMQGIMASANAPITKDNKWDGNIIVEVAVGMADALLEELEK
jgi:hypothetical protein